MKLNAEKFPKIAVKTRKIGSLFLQTLTRIYVSS